MVTASDVLGFWFGPSGDADRRDLWFGGGPSVDATVRERFGSTIDDALHGRIDEWGGSTRGRLALVLVLDQFTRNAFRGTRRAFAGDRMAQRHTAKAVAAGEDRLLRPFERAFLYMPFMHAEDPALQRRAMALFSRLVQDVPPSRRTAFQSFHDHALDHARILERFGRFPDRNRLLGRNSTPEETAFLRNEPRPWFETAPPLEG